MNGLEEFYSDFAPPPDFLNEQVKLHSSRESLKTVKQIVNLAEANIPFEIKNDWIKEEPKLDILCAHFNFGKNELEGADYPLFLSKILPNSNIYMSYDKSPRAKALYFKAEGNTLERVPPKKSYDIIIGRAGVFNYIKPNSRFKVQIKPMGWSDRRFHIGDLVFEDDYLGCPPSPIFRNNAKYVLDNFKKEKIIIFIGAINREKNQVGFIKMVDPELCKDYVFLFLGSGTRRMARKLSVECEKKKLKCYMGWSDAILMPYFTSISKLHVHNCAPNGGQYGQLYDPNPRCLGESIVSNNHSICSKTTLCSKDINDYVTIYDHNSEEALNNALEQALKINCSNYNKTFIKLEEKCWDMTKNILSHFYKI